MNWKPHNVPVAAKNLGGVYMKDNHDLEQYYHEPVETYQEALVDESQVALYIAKVMGWMCLGLLTTLTFAIVTLAVPSLTIMVLSGRYTFVVLCAAQLAVAFIFSLGLRKMSAGVATVTFLLYSALTGVTFSVLAFVFQLSSLFFVFGLTSLVFFVMAVYGYATKTDLTKLGTLALFALLGIIIASVFNLFILKSSMMELGICCIGIVIFIALTAYDTQKIKAFYIDAISAGQDDESQAVRKLAIFGAFTLYLDFINLFLKLLRILGKKRS